MEIVVRAVDAAATASAGEVEVVERKGLGHPDTICDALAERISVALCRHYLERFGVILHHNVDKILLVAGASRPAFGGGEVTAPMALYLAGRAVGEHRGERVPVAELAIAACRQWLAANLHALDADSVEIVPRFRPGSGELTRLFARGEAMPRANDTSCGAGFAPPTDLERVVLAVERALNDPETKRRLPALGEDVKVMGVRRGSRIELTIGCAMIDRFLPALADYEQATAAAEALTVEAARAATALEVRARVNAADDVARGELFLTVTGTSAEAGDDGETGRGNRVSGLITPYRAMAMEAAAGKNPVSHVGKLYNLAATRMAAVIAGEIPGIVDATCVAVSRIGAPIDAPQLVDVRLALAPGQTLAAVRDAVRVRVTGELARFGELREALLAGRVAVY